MRSINSPDVADITDKVWQVVNRLPHRSAIVEADARNWVDAVVGLHGEQAIWHAIRLNGFGGSEIGVLVRNLAGERADHQASAHDIVAGKLMRKAPTETSSHMTRGHENEEPHARRFYAKYGASRDIAAYEALKNVKGKFPWMRYSPDDIVNMPVTMLRLAHEPEGPVYASMREGKLNRWLIDYKSPSKVEASDAIAFQYVCQLAQGAILCHETGIELHGMMLSQFDWANWSLKDDVIEWSQPVGRAVLEAGSHYWDYVLRGEVPSYIIRSELAGAEAYAAQYLDLARTYASLSALENAAKAQADLVRPLLLQPLLKHRLAKQKVTFGPENVLTICAKKMLDREAVAKCFSPEQLARVSKGPKVYDQDRLVGALEQLGVDMAQFRKKDLSADAVFEVALEAGLDPEILQTEQLTCQVSQKLKDDMSLYVRVHYSFVPVTAATSAEDDSAADSDSSVQEDAMAPS